MTKLTVKEALDIARQVLHNKALSCEVEAIALVRGKSIRKELLDRAKVLTDAANTLKELYPSG